MEIALIFALWYVGGVVCAPNTVLRLNYTLRLFFFLNICICNFSVLSSFFVNLFGFFLLHRMYHKIHRSLHFRAFHQSLKNTLWNRMCLNTQMYNDIPPMIFTYIYLYRETLRGNPVTKSFAFTLISFHHNDINSSGCSMKPLYAKRSKWRENKR